MDTIANLLKNIVSNDSSSECSDNTPKNNSDSIDISTNKIETPSSNDSNGFVTRIGDGNYVARLLQAGTTNNLVVTNADGVSGNPTLDLNSTISINKLKLNNSSNNITLLASTSLDVNYSLYLPAVAPTTNQILVSDANGNFSWTTASSSINEVSFTTTSTWSVPNGVTSATFILVGAGGSGASAAANTVGVGSGGGSGALTRVTISNLINNTSINITIGIGGINNANGTSTTVNYTISGTTYTFTANGGSAGVFGTVSQGGVGGIASTLSSGVNGYSIGGANGQPGFVVSTVPVTYVAGGGGGSYLGGAGSGISSQTTMNGLSASINSGSGSGGAVNTGSTAGSSSAGGNGLCTIIY